MSHRKARVFRVSPSKSTCAFSVLAMAYALAFAYQSIWIEYQGRPLVINGVRHAAQYPVWPIYVMGILIVAITIWGARQYVCRIALSPDTGIQVFDEYNRMAFSSRWDEIVSYRRTLDAKGQPTWSLATSQIRIDLPQVEEFAEFQRTMLQHLPVDTVRAESAESRPSQIAPYEEARQTRCRTFDDGQNGFLGGLGLLTLAAFFYWFFADGTADLMFRGPLAGLIAGIVATGIGAIILRITGPAFRRIMRYRMDVTAQHLTLWDGESTTQIDWNRLVLVEKTDLTGLDSSDGAILLFDGRSSIVIRDNWPKRNLILQHASEKAPASTLFVGFD